MDAEIFIYLGFTSNTHFFMHTEFRYDNIEYMCCQVYNTMIHETMIRQNNKVIVFNFMKNGLVIVVTCNHVSFPDMKYYRDDLSRVFKRLLTADRRKTAKCMAIHCDNEKCLLYESNGDLFQNKLLPTEELKIDEVKYVATNKSIPYL